jgi:DNA (cytosine-5)-methyltransferase 1
LTDEQLAELEARQGQPEITTGLVDRLAAAPAPTEGFTDRQLDSLPVLASTPFAAERGIALPPEAPAEPEPMTDYELNQLEEENYRRVDYIMPQEEFRQYWTRRKEENNEVGRFIEGVGQGAASMLGMIPEAGREIRDGMVGMVTDPVNQVQRNVQTGAEIVRRGGINMVQLFDWVGNKANDAATWAKRRGLKQQALAKRLEQEGRLTGDELRDANIIAAAASEADVMEPTPVEEEEDFDRAYERYQREKALEQEFAGVTDFQIGASKVSAPAATKEAYQITDEQPAETLSMLGSMVVDPVNLIPVGAGALSKLRVLRRTATLAGAPLRGVQRAADATADLAERMEFGISSRVQDITGLTAKQQAALGAGAAGAAVYADAAGGGGNVTAAVTAIGSVLPGLRYGGAIIRKTGAAAGGAAAIIREAGVGGIGTARAEAAADLARMTAIPERYRKYFTGYVDGTDSTLKRVAQDAGNPEALRRVARFADRAGVTTAARLADDVTSGAVAAGITGAPFAALQPDAERAGEVLGGIMALGGVAGVAGSVARRGATEADADIARMMADVYAVGGNVDAFSALPHASLDRMAAMQGVLAGKVDFVPLKADEYRMNKDVSATGGELAAGLFLEKDANGRARVFINLDARKAAGGVDAIAPHEIGHAILTSNVLDGQPRNDLRNLVNQQYGPDGVTARGREYVGRLVDADINNGTTGELPQVLTEQEFRDLESGNKSAADISKARKLEPSERERLINERYEELSQRSIERGEDALDWARDEIIAETFASEAPAIDFRAIRRDAAFPRLAESMLATGGRVLEMMGVRLDSGTGKMLDNPSVLFRDNPLFQDRIMQKRVKEYVRAYDQYLVGLEEAGSATPRGVELARSNRPEDVARSTHVKLRDEGRGVLENDFLFQKPDGTYAYKPQPIINNAEGNRAAQIRTLYNANKFVPVNSTEFGRRKVNGRVVIGGPVLPPQFDLFTHFPQWLRPDPVTKDIGLIRKMEASRKEGGTWLIDYNRVGSGASGRYRILNMGNVRAIQTESSAPFGWLVSKANHLLAAGIDINAFRASAMKAINKGELGIFNNDMKQVEADLKTYLANHRSGLPGEATIGQQKRDTLNGLIGTGTAVQRAANPLYAELNPKGSIRTWRIDRLNDAQPSGRTGYFFDYDKINNNRMPQQIPREAQGMPDVRDILTEEYAAIANKVAAGEMQLDALTKDARALIEPFAKTIPKEIAQNILSMPGRMQGERALEYLSNAPASPASRAQFMPDVAEVSTSTSVSALQKHPLFKSAKYDGSAKAAYDIVESLVKPKAIQDVMSKIDPNRPAYIIPVIAREGESANMLPLAMADKLSEATGIPIWNKLAKTSSQHNTGAKADSRARTMHRWEGEPPPAGSQIVLVDDTYTTGQTLRSLAAVVGDPDAVATISVGRYTKQFTLQPDREQKLLAKAGLTKQQFNNLYGSEPKQILTGAQAQQYLLNGARGEQGLLARFPVERGGFSTQGIAGLTQLPEGVTTFSGGGLVEIGLRGIVRPTVAVEYSPAIAQAYRAAHGDHVKVQDIRTVSLEDHKGKFHYHASPVCKNSSLLKSAALGGGEKDLDLQSAQAVARHIDEIEPKVVTIENVPDYRTTQAADIIRKKLQDRGYMIDEAVYNAADYGAPTARRRYLLRAVKGGLLPEPVPQKGPSWYETIADIIDDLPDDKIENKPRPGQSHLWRKGNGLIEAFPDPMNVSEPVLISGTTLFKKVAFSRAGQPAFTYKATPATADRILLPGGRVKRVTARAKARMTGIPDSYPLPKDEKTALTIIGNGVPPALVRNVFGPVIEANK